jgi:hypothetical protein
VAAYIETLQRQVAPPTVKQDMAAIRMLFAGSLRFSDGSDEDFSQKLTDLFAFVNTFPECATGS